MAGSLDALMQFLLDEIALSGQQGEAVRRRKLLALLIHFGRDHIPM